MRLRRDKRAWFGVGVIVLPRAAGGRRAGRRAPRSVRASISSTRCSRRRSTHWLGTDIQGRDVWARLVYGARVSLSVGIVSQGIALDARRHARSHRRLLRRLGRRARDAPRRRHARVSDAAAAHRAGRGAAAVADGRVPHDRRRRLGGHGAARPRAGARRARAGVRAGGARARRARRAHHRAGTCCRASSRRS